MIGGDGAGKKQAAGCGLRVARGGEAKASRYAPTNKGSILEYLGTWEYYLFAFLP